MNALKRFETMIADHKEDECNKVTLALAYLQLHHDNPYLHPDEYTNPDGGYGGWHVLLMNLADQRFSSAPEGFTYPIFLTEVYHPLELLRTFHADDETEEMQNCVERVIDFLSDMREESLQACIEDIDRLTIYHADGPEEITQPMHDTAGILLWVAQLSNKGEDESELKLSLKWNAWDTGGHCIVYTFDVELRDGRTVSLGVSDECVCLYPHAWTYGGNWDTGEYLFVWNYDESELNLRTNLAIHLRDGNRKDDLIADIAAIMAHLSWRGEENEQI